MSGNSERRVSTEVPLLMTLTLGTGELTAWAGADNDVIPSRLKVTDARNLPKPVKVALRTRDKIAKSPEELLKWVKDLNPGLHVENWRVLVNQPEHKGQRLIPLIDRESLTAIKGTGYKIYAGLTQGTVKVLKDPEVGPQKEQVTAETPESTESGSGGEGAARPPSPRDRNF
jgi:hypothetical protein